jgi:DNA-binding NarL/FixJ family response regulator
MLTTFQREEYLVASLRAGACGYLLKNTPPERLIAAVHSAAAGDALVAPELTGALIRRALSGQDPSGDAAEPSLAAAGPGDPVEVSPGVELTPRETEVLRLMAEGLSNAEIAARMVVGRATVKTHVSNVLMKLGVRDRVQAVVWAHRHGLAR